MACVKAILQVEPAPFSFSRLPPSSCMELMNRMSSTNYELHKRYSAKSYVWNIWSFWFRYGIWVSNSLVSAYFLHHFFTFPLIIIHPIKPNSSYCNECFMLPTHNFPMDYILVQIYTCFFCSSCFNLLVLSIKASYYNQGKIYWQKPKNPKSFQINPIR